MIVVFKACDTQQLLLAEFLYLIYKKDGRDIAVMNFEYYFGRFKQLSFVD
jgi:hypothetical protein